MIQPRSVVPLRPLLAAACCALALVGCSPSPAPDDGPHDAGTAPAPIDPAAAPGADTAAPGTTPPAPESDAGHPAALDPALDLADAVPFESPLGYTILVPPSFAMTQEEPCCDQAWVRGSGAHFLRIERIRPEADLAGLEADMALALSSVGPAAAAPHPALDGHEIETALSAQAPGLSATMLVSRVGDGRYRITRHVPRDDSAPAVEAEMQAMLASMRTTGPWEAP